MNSIAEEDTIKDVYNFLDEFGCCARCIVRFLGVYVTENEGAYKTPEDFFGKHNIKATANDENEASPKKRKRNCCPACLNCFDLTKIESFAEKLKETDINEYNYNTYMLNVSFPKCLALRTYSIFLHLKQKFPTIALYNKKLDDELSVEQPYKILRSISSKIFKNILDKEYSPKSNLTIFMHLGYENDEIEVKSLEPPTKKPNKKKLRYEKKKPKSSVSRNEILEIVKNIKDDQFKKLYSVPPEIPNKGVFVEKIEIQTDPIYIGGRYLKFKRNVGQTPWIVDGVSLSEHNVQQILFEAIGKICGINKSQMTFTSSGREDVDVRMLGNGRPFYIKIDKSKKFRICDSDLLRVQEEIIKTDLVAVIKLQHVYTSDIKRIKFGEENKQKTYLALCHTKAPNVEDVVHLINKNSDGVTIIQTTALRVLHRRTLLPRERRIYSISSKVIPGSDSLFELEVVTQAGTYVKEFVHGDFSRTLPNISSMVGYPTDIIALDCIDIHLEWPEDEIAKNNELVTELIENKVLKNETVNNSKIGEV